MIAARSCSFSVSRATGPSGMPARMASSSAVGSGSSSVPLRSAITSSSPHQPVSGQNFSIRSISSGYSARTAATCSSSDEVCFETSEMDITSHVSSTAADVLTIGPVGGARVAAVVSSSNGIARQL